MQTIWTRALQVRSSCYCPFCLPTRQGLVRRLNVRPPRRKLQFGDYLTACYGTLLGTAAVVEVKRKQDQRKALDGAIDNVKEEVIALCEDQEKRLNQLGYALGDNFKDVVEKQSKRKDHHAETIRLIENLKINGAGQTQQPTHFLPALARERRQPTSTQGATIATGTKCAGAQGYYGGFSWGASELSGQSLPTAPVDAHPGTSVHATRDTDSTVIGSCPNDENTLNLLKDEHDPVTAPEGYAGQVDADEISLNTEVVEKAATISEKSIHMLFQPQSTFDASIDHNLAEELSPIEQEPEAQPKRMDLGLSSLEAKNLMDIPSTKTASTGHTLKHFGHRFKPFTPESQKYAFESPNSFRGRSSEEVWNSEETPFVGPRNRKQREAAIARLVYKMALSYFETPEVKSGEWPDNLSLDLAGEEVLELSFANKPELCEQVEDLDHRLRVLQGLRKRLPNLVSIQDLSFPSYQSFDKDDRQSEASYIAAQNDALLNIFMTTRDPGTLFSRLCSTLLSQSFAPNIHTFNLLIIRLCHVQFFSAAKLVIEALHASSLNHNEVTYSAILNCYISLSELKDFQGYVNRMEGIAGSGVRTTFDRQEVVQSLQPNLYYHQPRNLPLLDEHDPPLIDEVYGEKAKKNDEVYEAMIIGTLCIGNPEKAISYFYAMLSNGLSPSRTVLQELLEYSVRVSDWHIGLSIWERMKTRFHPLPVMTYYWMLQLCVECRLPAHFELVLQDGLQHNILSSRLLYDDFMLSEEQKYRIFSRVHETRKLKRNVWIPGLPRSSFLDDMEDSPPSSNLYLAQVTEYLTLFEAKQKELGWLVDARGGIRAASNELLRLRRAGHFSEERLLSKATWLSERLKAQQCCDPQVEKLRFLQAAPNRKVLHAVPLPKIKRIVPKERTLTVDLSKSADKDTLDALRSYLSKMEKNGSSKGRGSKDLRLGEGIHAPIRRFRALMTLRHART